MENFRQILCKPLQVEFPPPRAQDTGCSARCPCEPNRKYPGGEIYFLKYPDGGEIYLNQKYPDGGEIYLNQKYPGRDIYFNRKYPGGEIYFIQKYPGEEIYVNQKYPGRKIYLNQKYPWRETYFNQKCPATDSFSLSTKAKKVFGPDESCYWYLG